MYIDKSITYKFGFNILFEEKKRDDNETIEPDDTSKDYSEGKITKRFVKDFTDDAIICRSILYYCIAYENTGFFKSRYIIENWLLKNCQYFKDKYPGKLNKTNPKNKVEQNNSHVALLLERLRYLSLLESRCVEAKNHLDTTEYRFTDLGKLVSLLLKYYENNRDYSLVDKIYAQTLNYYRTQNYSFAKFCVLFFTNCYNRDRRLFDIVIIPNLMRIIEQLRNDKNSVLNKLRNFPIIYDSESLVTILINSLNEFKSNFPDDYQKVIYKLRLATELYAQNNCKNLEEFEKLRFDNNGLISVVLEGYCNTCNKYTPIKIPSMFSYFKACVKNADKSIQMDCINCNSKNGLHFEILPSPQNISE